MVGGDKLKPHLGQIVYYGVKIVNRLATRPCMITNIHPSGLVDLERFGYFASEKYYFNIEYSEELDIGKWTHLEKDRFTQLL